MREGDYSKKSAEVSSGLGGLQSRTLSPPINNAKHKILSGLYNISTPLDVADDANVDFSELKVAELRDECAKRGLDTKGVKAVLIKRLNEAAEEQEEDDNDETIPSPPIARTWLCDICQVTKCSSFDGASRHEKVCSASVNVVTSPKRS